MLELSFAQKKRFYEEGYLHIPGVVPAPLVHAARKSINASLGTEGIDPAQLIKFRSQSYCPEIQRSEAIVGLVTKTPAWDYAQSLTAEGTLVPPTAAQVALRFPTLLDPPPLPKPHLDGMYSPHNGVTKGSLQNFTRNYSRYTKDGINLRYFEIRTSQVLPVCSICRSWVENPRQQSATVLRTEGWLSP